MNRNRSSNMGTSKRERSFGSGATSALPGPSVCQAGRPRLPRRPFKSEALRKKDKDGAHLAGLPKCAFVGTRGFVRPWEALLCGGHFPSDITENMLSHLAMVPV